ncbi:unnamed protein product [Calypogeia fissa]
MDLQLIMKEPISRLNAVEDDAVKALDNGDHDRALFFRMQALALAKLCMDDPNVAEKDTILAKAHLRLSATYLGMGSGDQAYWHAQRAMDSGDPRRSGSVNPAGNSILLVSILLALAKAMLMRADARCQSYLTRALQINIDLTSEEDPSNAAIHEAFGDLFVFAKDSGAPMIENDTQGMKRTNKKQSGGKSPKSPKTPTSPTNSLQIGAMDEANQDLYERGLIYFDKAWELINKSVKGTVKGNGKKVTIDPALAQLYSKIAKTKAKQGHDEEASDMYDKAISSHEKAIVPNGSAVAHLNYELGCIYRRLKKYRDALSSLEKGSKFCDEQKDIGRSDPLGLVIQKEQGVTMYEKKEYGKAKGIFEELLQLQRTEYGGGSGIVAETLEYLGDCALGLKDLPEACHRYNRAVRIMKRKYGALDPNVRDLVDKIRQLNLEDQSWE